MIRFAAPLLALALAAAAPALAHAQVGGLPKIPPGAPTAQVSIRLGEIIQPMISRYGPDELKDLEALLQRQVALAGGKGGFVRADLVLEDAKPNRPTFAQQGVNPDISFRSIALGGAFITGSIVRADGSTQPLKFSWYETDLRDDRGASTWYDAERAFDLLSGDLVHGRVPNTTHPGGVPNPYRCNGGLDAFCHS